MGAPVKSMDNQTKHLTNAERLARQSAEDSLGLGRDNAEKLRAPKGLSGSAKTYWNNIVERCKDVLLIDELDQEMLAVYCQMLARRDKLNRLCEKLLKASLKEDFESENSEATDKLDGLVKQVAALERNLMTYADKLGFTPQSRVRLAQKRAAAAMADPEGDFFGD